MSSKEVSWKDDLLRVHSATLQKDVVIFKGARPTLITPSTIYQRQEFLTMLCARMDFIPVTEQTLSLLLWWPDLGGRRRLCQVGVEFMDHVIKYEKMLLNILMWRLESEYPDQVGFSLSQAKELQTWYHNLPNNQHLRYLLNRLSHWYSPPYPDTAEIPAALDWSIKSSGIETDVTTQENLLTESTANTINITEDDDFATDTHVESQTATISLHGWSKGQQTRILLLCKQTNPSFDVADERTKSYILHRKIKEFVIQKQREWIDKQRILGNLIIYPDESHQMQFQRLWKQETIRRLQTSYHEDAQVYACSFCAFHVNKTVQPRNDLKFICHPSQGCCPVDKSHMLGWTLVEGSVTADFFPMNNIFNLFVDNAIVPNTAVNHNQLASAFLMFCSQNLRHPQALEIHQKYLHISEHIIRMMPMRRADMERGKPNVSSFKQELLLAIRRLSKLREIVELQREALPEEKRLYGRTFKGTCFVFDPFIDHENFVEDLDFCNYRTALNLRFDVTSVLTRPLNEA
ncbi:hypothetical protein Unana1_00241 [Umbelopsis nana]